MHPEIRLRLYVTGRSTRSERAVSHVSELKDERFGLACSIEIVDALERPDLAELDRIIATPTLLRVLPKPEMRIIGDLASGDAIVSALDLERAEANDA
ncbi:MAG: circadian clock KaiB family protein [Pseudomonadota bacterium]